MQEDKQIQTLLDKRLNPLKKRLDLHSWSTHQGFCATPEQTGDDAGPRHTFLQPPEKTKQESEASYCMKTSRRSEGGPYHLIAVERLTPPQPVLVAFQFQLWEQSRQWRQVCIHSSSAYLFLFQVSDFVPEADEAIFNIGIIAVIDGAGFQVEGLDSGSTRRAHLWAAHQHQSILHPFRRSLRKRANVQISGRKQLYHFDPLAGKMAHFKFRFERRTKAGQ